MSVLEREDRDGVAVLFLNRPERRNALSGELIDALGAALDAADADPAVRAIVLAGRGKAFCAGGDLAGGFGQGLEGVIAQEDARAGFGDLLARIPRLGRPVIAAVHGQAYGGGLGLVAACDLVVVDAEAKLGTPEIKVGLFPFVITAALQRCVPKRALLEMMLVGEPITAEDAVRLGLANRVAPAGDALEVAVQMASVIASRSRAIVGLGKRAFHQVADLSYEDALRVLNGRLSINLLTEDAMEGIAAFLARRDPEWKDR